MSKDAAASASAAAASGLMSPSHQLDSSSRYGVPLHKGTEAQQACTNTRKVSNIKNKLNARVVSPYARKVQKFSLRIRRVQRTSLWIGKAQRL